MLVYSNVIEIEIEFPFIVPVRFCFDLLETKRNSLLGWSVRTAPWCACIENKTSLLRDLVSSKNETRTQPKNGVKYVFRGRFSPQQWRHRWWFINVFFSFCLQVVFFCYWCNFKTGKNNWIRFVFVAFLKRFVFFLVL